MKRTFLATVGVVLTLPALASAAVIPLVNSGVGAGGSRSTGDIDPNFVVSGGTADGNAYVIMDEGQYPFNTWVGANGISDWITPYRDPSGWAPGGVYTFKTTFDLTGLDPTTASITGRWAVDNAAKILLNGVDTGIALDDKGYTELHDFMIGSGFVDGVNTLEFVVDNIHDPSPAGLRVELSGAASGGGQVPEPSTMLAFGLALAGAAAYRRRKIVAA